MSCPNCGSNAQQRSHRRGLLERVVLTFLGFLPYVCSACHHRYYARRGRAGRQRWMIARRRCPFCRGREVYRSRRTSSGDTLRKLLLLVPYRCHACNARVSGFRWLGGHLPGA